MSSSVHRARAGPAGRSGARGRHGGGAAGPPGAWLGGSPVGHLVGPRGPMAEPAPVRRAPPARTPRPRLGEGPRVPARWVSVLGSSRGGRGPVGGV